MAKKKRGAPPRYDAKVKAQVIEQAKAGRPLAELAQEFGPTPLSIRNWLREVPGAPRQRRTAAAPNGELETLRKQNRMLRDLVIQLLG